MNENNNEEKPYWISLVSNYTKNFNVDNISRTKAYQSFFKKNPEIKWAFLASMVSRNAGWNMTELETNVYKEILSNKIRKQLFSTYERANWLIFSDAYPQLLLYQLSKELNRPMFDKLRYLSVSSFMIKEWYHFWSCNDENRLMTALIINEQNIIQTPVTDHPFYKKNVFSRWPYLLQDFFYLNAIIFPSRKGDMFAYYVHDFRDITKRISFGKKLASILFNEKLFDEYLDFALNTEHTGSTIDYIKYLSKSPREASPILRTNLPIISHQDKIRIDWYLKGGCKQKWWKTYNVDLNDNSWNSFQIKKETIQIFYKLKTLLNKK
ncbi:DUF2515 domain-containing protein [Aquibacillus halophilus]|uniref:DUF2515 domain-containing protein n=1 Tax=Aquibacillus halophilus TaxID=930132 RepID=A0A6A8DF91_9BACI|nr:DUF2515 family protein [Aquibacillus halophilus]MRH42441.1 DUF2515 domain-containing protein [Aquibacillus halophilus]